MDIYLAARYSRYPEMQRYADDLRARGHTITSAWIAGDHEVDWTDPRQAEAERVRFAVEDLADLMKANICISFTEEPGNAPGRNRGGRHVEFGIALSLAMQHEGMTCIVVGPRENVFHCLPQVRVYATWDDALPMFGPVLAQEIRA